MATKTVLGNVVTAVTNNIAKIKTAIGNATTSAAGLMSSTDKTKLDGVADSANKTTIVNNLTATTAGSALDATQGKALSDKITSLNDSLTKHGFEKAVIKQNIDITTLTAGNYFCYPSCSNLPLSNNYYWVHVIYFDSWYSVIIAIPSDLSTPKLYVKRNTYNNWGAWITFTGV